ncbi:MAG: DMT family transporter [Alphaproteobacteria bacterium]|nr:DMT family transporter [Alphaproteobacteria bacterium]
MDVNWIAATPAVFVVLWSTGFIGAKLGLPFSEPFTFLFTRMAIVAGLLSALALVLRSAWPRDLAEAGHIAVSGLLVHAAYLGGVFAAIHAGMPAGLCSLIVGLQPLLTAMLARRVVGERVTPRQWLGLSLGLAGVTLVLGDKLAPAGAAVFAGFGPGALGLAAMALAGITAGTLYQKRFCSGMNLASGTAIQNAASAVAMGLAALTFETMRIEWTAQFVFALAWLVLVLSLAAISLLMLLIRRGAVSRVASFFYLVPPLTALEAWLLFDERLGAMALVGMLVVAAAVALVIGRPANG